MELNFARDPSSFVVFLFVEVLSNTRRSQKLLDPFRFVESLVDPKPNIGCKF